MTQRPQIRHGLIRSEENHFSNKFEEVGKEEADWFNQTNHKREVSQTGRAFFRSSHTFRRRGLSLRVKKEGEQRSLFSPWPWGGEMEKSLILFRVGNALPKRKKERRAPPTFGNKGERKETCPSSLIPFTKNEGQGGRRNNLLNALARNERGKEEKAGQPPLPSRH